MRTSNAKSNRKDHAVEETNADRLNYHVLPIQLYRPAGKNEVRLVYRAYSNVTQGFSTRHQKSFSIGKLTEDGAWSDAKKAYAFLETHRQLPNQIELPRSALLKSVVPPSRKAKSRRGTKDKASPDESDEDEESFKIADSAPILRPTRTKCQPTRFQPCDPPVSLKMPPSPPSMPSGTDIKADVQSRLSIPEEELIGSMEEVISLPSSTSLSNEEDEIYYDVETTTMESVEERSSMDWTPEIPPYESFITIVNPGHFCAPSYPPGYVKSPPIPFAVTMGLNKEAAPLFGPAISRSPSSTRSLVVPHTAAYPAAKLSSDIRIVPSQADLNPSSSTSSDEYDDESDSNMIRFTSGLWHQGPATMPMSILTCH